MSDLAKWGDEISHHCYTETEDWTKHQISLLLDAARREALAEKLPCGHPVACLVVAPTVEINGYLEKPAHRPYCAWCADIERAKEAVREACVAECERGQGRVSSGRYFADLIRSLNLSKIGGHK